MSTIDYDGDGDTLEGIAGEIDTLRETPYTVIRDYSARIDEAEPIVYDGGVYPFFFIDINGNGEPDPDEVDYDNRYNTWSPRLLRAAYNYHYVGQDPGSFAHNGKYVIQILYDSLEDMGGVDMAEMARPFKS